MGSDGVESCGRCGVSSIVEAACSSGNDDGAARERLFGGGRIEVTESAMRRVSPHAVLAHRVKTWLDTLGFRLIYGDLAGD